MTDILKAIDHYDRNKDHHPPVCEYVGHSRSTWIQVLGYLNHLFVIYKSPGTKQVYISDGANLFLEDVECRNKVIAKIGTKPRGIPFVGQNSVDHCGASAVMIALEFRRVWRNREEPMVLKAERQRYELIKKHFYSEPSQILTTDTPFRNLVPDVCPNCGKTYNARNRRAFHAHVLGHRNASR